MAVLMPYGEGSLLITPWLKVIGIPDDVKCCHMGALLRTLDQNLGVPEEVGWAMWALGS